jgi:hypothetical protein
MLRVPWICPTIDRPGISSGPEPNAIAPSGGILTNEPRNGPKPVKRPGTSSTGSSPDAMSAEEMRAIRKRLDEGFYEQPEVVDAIAEAVRKDLRLDF